MINFTPWRLRQRRQFQRRFFIRTGWSAGCGVLIVAIMAWYWHQQTYYLQQDISQVIAEQTMLQPQIEQITHRQQMIAKHQRVQQITKQQRHYYQTLLWLATHWPASAQLNAIDFSNQTYQLNGLARTAHALAELIESLKRLSYVKHIEAGDWNVVEKSQGQFTLKIHLMESDDAQAFS